MPIIGPGLVEIRKHFLGGLYLRGLIFGGGGYIRRALCVNVRGSRP